MGPAMSQFRNHMDCNLGRSCPHMGPSWGQAAPSWCQVGPKLEPSGPKLGPCWPKLTLSGADVAAMSNRNGAFGRCYADMLVPGEHAPPAEAAPVKRGLFESIGSAPKLSCLGTCGTGGFGETDVSRGLKD